MFSQEESRRGACDEHPMFALPSMSALWAADRGLLAETDIAGGFRDACLDSRLLTTLPIELLKKTGSGNLSGCTQRMFASAAPPFSDAPNLTSLSESEPEPAGTDKWH
ncbi:hypothetical protein MRX96_005996 [Rhipicephalus microplus]